MYGKIYFLYTKKRPHIDFELRPIFRSYATSKDKIHGKKEGEHKIKQGDKTERKKGKRCGGIRFDF